MFRKISLFAIIIFIVSISFVSGAEIDISQDVKNCILDNFDKYNFTKTTIIFYYDNETCAECSNYTAQTDELIFETMSCFSDVGPSLAICLNNFEAIQDVSLADLSGLINKCEKYIPDETKRKIITIPRQGDDDNDHPIRIYEDTGEIIGIGKTVYDVYSNNYNTVQDVINTNEDFAEKIGTEEKNYQTKVKEETRKKAMGEAAIWEAEAEKIKQKYDNCSARRNEAGSLAKQTFSDLKTQIAEGKHAPVNLSEESRKITEKILANIEDCNMYDEELRQLKLKRNEKYARVESDPQGLNSSNGKYNQSEKEYLKQYDSRDKKIILSQLSSKEIKVEKIEGNNAKGKSTATGWIKTFLLKIFG